MSLDARRIAMLREMGITAWELRSGGTATEAAEPAATAPGDDALLPEVLDEAPSGPRVAPLRPLAEAFPVDMGRRPQEAAEAEARAATASPAAARGGRAQDIAALDWPGLRAAVAACTACKLCESRRNTVFGVGSEQADWMIIGEAPGESEDRQGEPFVGQAGKLLDNMLRAIGLTREASTPDKQVFIANVLKCRPPNNRNPQPEEIAKCEPFLRRQVELVQPKIILAMGRFALQTLLQTDEPVGRLRGRVHRYQGVPVVVTYHPAYLLRNLPEKARAWEDLCLALDTLNKS
jgi:DNA polymerase